MERMATQQSAAVLSQAERQAIVESAQSLSQAVAGNCASSGGTSLGVSLAMLDIADGNIQGAGQIFWECWQLRPQRLKSANSSNCGSGRGLARGQWWEWLAGVAYFAGTVAWESHLREQTSVPERRSGSSFSMANRQLFHRPRPLDCQNIR